jgi:hypothetical protein
LNVVTGSAVCSNITGAPHEYFYQTGTSRMKIRQVAKGWSAIDLPA